VRNLKSNDTTKQEDLKNATHSIEAPLSLAKGGVIHFL